MSTRIVAPWCVLQKISCRNFLWTCGGLRVAGGLGEVGGGWSGGGFILIIGLDI